MIMASAVMSTGLSRLTPASQAAVSGSMALPEMIPCKRSPPGTEFAVATPRLMICSHQRGDAKRGEREIESPHHPRQRTRKRRDNNERVQPALKVNHQ